MTVIEDRLILCEPDVWPRKGRGGFLRNQQDQVVVSHPGGGNRTLIYDGASSLLDFGRPYAGDPIHGERGTHVHAICDDVDRGVARLHDVFVAQGVALGIPADLQHHIAAEWQQVRAEHGITTSYVEECVVDDGWRVATNVDRVSRTADGRDVVEDIKTASSYERAAYVLQLAVGARSIMYDPDSGLRTPWPVDIDANVGHIWWFPIRAAIEAEAQGDPLPTWTLVEVQLAHGYDLGERLHALKTDQGHRECFTVAVAAPTCSAGSGGDAVAAPPLHLPGGVEQRGEGAVTHSCDAAPSPTLEELRAVVTTWPDDRKADFGRFLTVESVDRTDPEQVAAAIERYTFADVRSEPEPTRAALGGRVNPALAPRPQLNRSPDEGGAIDDATYEMAKAQYEALDDAARSWVGQIVRESTRAGMSVRLSDARTVRRFEVMRGLLALAAHGFDNADAVRGCAADAVGAEIADSLAFSLGQVVGTMDAQQAATFAWVCDALATGRASMAYLSTGACRISS